MTFTTRAREPRSRPARAPYTVIRCDPNAGPLNLLRETGIAKTCEVSSRLLDEFAHDALVSPLGGQCGTTPERIAAIRQAIMEVVPRPALAATPLPA